MAFRVLGADRRRLASAAGRGDIHHLNTPHNSAKTVKP